MADLPQKIVSLKNFLRTKVYLPRTVTKAVYDEQGNRLDNVLGGISADVNELQKNNLGNGVPIEDRTETNKYTCPSDGYIRAYISRASTGYVRARIDSANENGNYIAISAFANTQDNAFNSIFVKKGMKVFVASSVGDFTLRFIPLG